MNTLTIAYRIMLLAAAAVIFLLLVGYNGLSFGNKGAGSSAQAAHKLDRLATDMRQLVAAYPLCRELR